MLHSVWNDFLEHFKKNSGEFPVVFDLLRLTELESITETEVGLLCSDNGAKFYLERKREDVERTISSFFKKKLTIRIVVKEKQRKKESPLLSFQPTQEDVFIRAGLYPKYRFENFAVSQTNSVAFAAAQAVSKNPGTSYNPLFLYGGVGVGKTHIAQSVARLILEKNRDKKVLFCPGDRFMNELIESIQDKSMIKFRKKYRYLDMFIVDDIQFIAGKQTVQEEFFHTFNSMIASGSQIILTSDRHPSSIKNLEDRLRSRFSGGLIVDVQPPDFELRTAILLIKAKEKNIEIDIEAAKIISEQIADSRALEGTLLSVYAKTLGQKERIDIEAVELFFQDSSEKRSRKITTQDVVRATCSLYNVRASQIRSSSRSNNIVLPRQIIMYILRKELKINLDQIAHLLKRKDHTTVMHGCEKISKMMIKDQSFKIEVDRIISSLTLST